MIRRTTPAVILLILVSLVGVASGGTGLLLGLAPAFAVLIPLVAGMFPGERAIAAAGRWLGSVRERGRGIAPTVPLDFMVVTVRAGIAGLGFGTRGPPPLLADC